MSTSLSCGIVGLPNVGKSTLFNALTSSQGADASNFPFCTIEPNKGLVQVPDARLAVLSKMCETDKTVHAMTEFVDIAGLVKGASKGEGLGNKFLKNIRDTDAIVHVVRCFDNPNIVHVSGSVNPIDDIEVIHIELTLADIQSIEKIVPKLEKQVRVDKDAKAVIELLKKITEELDAGNPIRGVQLSEDERALIKPYRFLTDKPVLYLANVSEEFLPEMDNEYVQILKEYAKKEKSLVVPICAKLEEEIAQLPLEERGEFLESVGLEEPGLQTLIRTSFEMLGLITFLTAGKKEVRAWTIVKGTSAQRAAGKIHTDIEKGFIRAEVITYEQHVEYLSRVKAREAGVARAEGKEYLVKDGDVIQFFHN